MHYLPFGNILKNLLKHLNSLIFLLKKENNVNVSCYLSTDESGIFQLNEKAIEHM